MGFDGDIWGYMVPVLAGLFGLVLIFSTVKVVH